jgi:hypothetical protein
MKKIIFPVLFLGAAVFCFAQTATLDVALSGAKNYIEGRLPQGSRVLIADPAAPGRELGPYVARELSGLLVNGKRLTIVERGADVMQRLNAENSYQLSGEVSDESIQGIGQQSGAEAIITGVINGADDKYRLSLKITSVRTAELLGQYAVSFQGDTILNALLASSRPPARLKPQWIDMPLSARDNPQSNDPPGGVSSWYYDVGISNKTTSQQTSRTRARQDIQRNIAANIASDIRVRIDITELSMFQASGIEDVETRIEAALTNSIRTRVPASEILEWYDETGNTGGRDWHLAYVLVRFPRRGIITMVENLNTGAVADTVIRELKVPATGKPEFLRLLEEARSDALEMIRQGFR